MPGNGSRQGRVLRLDAGENVLVALTELREGENVSFLVNDYLLVSEVPAKHKFVTEDLSAGDEIIMYGVLVGRAVENLRRGELLSTRNIRHAAAAFHEIEEAGPQWTPPDISAWRRRTFLGYHKADSQVDSRNYLLVVPLVVFENPKVAVLKHGFAEEF